ncbi:MAG TPA: hypothetical protein VKC53_02480 [Patescibacteria group bacterium]|nr:hypothetical protein [Patescibacteria group bacterium]
MPPEDVSLLLMAAVVDKELEAHLLDGRIDQALERAKLVDPISEINLSESDIKGLLSITAEKLSGFTEACIGMGLLGRRRI